MAATLLDAITATSGSFPTTMAVSAGSNRLVFLATLTSDGSDAGPATSAALGGQAMTKLGEADAVERDVATTIWMLDEVGIQAMSGTTLSVSGGNNFKGAFLWSVQDAAQTITNVNSAVVNFAGSGNLSLARVADGITFAVSALDSEGATVDFTNPTDTDSLSAASLTGTIGYEASTAETVDWTWDSNFNRDHAAVIFNIGPGGPDYTARKGSTFTVTHGLGTAPDSVTINALACTITNATTTTVDVTVDAAITTSGEYDIVIEDTVAVTSETQTVQVNVVGLPSFNINKDGADQASLADVEFIALSGTAGSRAVADQVSGITTDVNGDTGPIEFTDLALSVGDTVFVVQYSPTVSGGHPGSATLEAI